MAFCTSCNHYLGKHGICHYRLAKNNSIISLAMLKAAMLTALDGISADKVVSVMMIIFSGLTCRIQ